MRGALRDREKGPRPDIGMRQSSFRTHTLNLVGTPNAAIRIAPADSVYSQRVLVRHATAGARVIVGPDPAELDMLQSVAQPIPMTSYGVPANMPTPMVLAPGQALWGAGTVAGIRVSVHSSQVIPIPSGDSPLYDDIAQPVFRRIFLRAAGPVVAPWPSASSIIVTASPRPQRVVVSHYSDLFPPRVVYVSSGSEGTLDTYPAAGPIPFAYEVGSAEATLFVLAPGQHLEAAANQTTVSVFVQAAEISLKRVLGPTGIPGPGGEE